MNTTPGKAEMLYYDEYMKPDTNNPYFYRSKDKIYFLGMECLPLDYVEMGLYTSLTGNCDLDANIPLGPELLGVLKYEVTNLARWSLIVPNERVNEGSDMTNQAITQSNLKIPSLDSPDKGDDGKQKSE